MNTQIPFTTLRCAPNTSFSIKYMYVCRFSTMLIERPAWNDDMSDLCCPEVCVFRKDTSSGKGTGDQCYVQRTTATARTTPAPLPACPQPCKGIYDGFRARGYSDKACIDLAKNGYVCDKPVLPLPLCMHSRIVPLPGCQL